MKKQTSLSLSDEESLENNTMRRVFIEPLPEEQHQASVILALMNNKGGVGKTSMSLAFGLTMARKGKNVLFWDNDSQSNLTQRLGVTDNTLEDRRLNVAFSLSCNRGTSDVIKNLPFVLEYPYFTRYRGHKTKTGHIAIMAGSHDAELDANNAFGKLNSGTKDYPNIFEFFKQTLEFYRTYFDYIIIDTAPALEGNILNQLAARVADYVIVPTDGLEAALGTEQLIRWVRGEVSPEKTGRKYPPDLLFAMVKYSADSHKKTETASTVDINYRLRNDVYRAMKDIFHDYVCESGVKSSKTLKSKTSFTKTDFDAVVNELQIKIEDKSRSNFYTLWNPNEPEMTKELRDKLEAVANKNIDRRPVFKSPKYIL